MSGSTSSHRPSPGPLPTRAILASPPETELMYQQHQMLQQPQQPQQQHHQQQLQQPNDLQQPSEDERHCKVCGDRAVYVNYGALTCDSCKTFFRRQNLQPKTLMCNYSNNCHINMRTRKDCTKCRLQKCFDVGMRSEVIGSATSERQRKEMFIELVKHRDDTDGPVPGTSSAQLNGHAEYLEFGNSGSGGSPRSDIHRGTAMAPTHHQLFELQSDSSSDISDLGSCLSITHFDTASKLNNGATGGASTSTASGHYSADPSTPFSQPAASATRTCSSTIIPSRFGGSSIPPSTVVPVTNGCYKLSNGVAVPPVATANGAPIKLLNGERASQVQMKRRRPRPVSPSERQQAQWGSQRSPGSPLDHHLSTGYAYIRHLSGVEQKQIAEVIHIAEGFYKTPYVKYNGGGLLGEVGGGPADGRPREVVEALRMKVFGVNKMIGGMNCLPAFHGLGETAKIDLMQSACSEMMIVRSAMHFDPASNSWAIQATQPSTAQRPDTDTASLSVDTLVIEVGSDAAQYRDEYHRFWELFDQRWKTDDILITLLLIVILFNRYKVEPTPVCKFVRYQHRIYQHLLRRYLETTNDSYESATETFFKLKTIQVVTSNLKETLEGALIDLSSLEKVALMSGHAQENPSAVGPPAPDQVPIAMVTID